MQVFIQAQVHQRRSSPAYRSGGCNIIVLIVEMVVH